MRRMLSGEAKFTFMSMLMLKSAVIHSGFILLRISSFSHMTFLLWLSSVDLAFFILFHLSSALSSFFSGYQTFLFITELRHFLSVLHILRFSCRRRHPVRGILTYLLAIAGF